MTAVAASARSMIPVAAQRISVKGPGCASDLASDAVDAFAAMATTPSLNWQRQLIARRFLAAFAGLDEWQRAPLAARLAARVDVRGFAAWWAITARHRVDAAYAIASRACRGTHLAGAHPASHAAFDDQARALGFTTGQARAQWAALATLTAIGGTDPAALTRVPFDAALGVLDAPGQPSITWSIPEELPSGRPPAHQRAKDQNDNQARNALTLGGFRLSRTPGSGSGSGSGIVARPTLGALSGTLMPFAIVSAPDGALLAGAANPTATAGREEHHRACDDRTSGQSSPST